MNKSYAFIAFILLISPILPAEESPYFVDTPTVYEKRILLRQTFIHSFDTVGPAVIDSIKTDSSFSCQDAACEWSHTYAFDTIQRIDFNCTEKDSFAFIDTLAYSFFDGENDSCHFNVWLLDGFGNRITPDSVWGRLHARPGADNKIYFSSHASIAAKRRFVLAMNQIENGTDTVFETITEPSRVSIQNPVVTDSAFLQKLQGSWQLVYYRYDRSETDIQTRSVQNSSYWAVVRDTRFSARNPNSLIIDEGPISLKDRIGFKIPYKSCTQTVTGYLLLGDTLVTTLSKCGQSGYLYTCVYIRSQSQTILDRNKRLKEHGRLMRIVNNNSGSSASIILNIEKPSTMDLSLYDLKGRKVLQLVRPNIQAGYHTIPLSNKKLPRQTYLLRLKIDGKVYEQSINIVQ
ncbi:MAG: hypothetical protein JW913_13360 [Chitinispirillaceae bacterium]|nr:hypothetical protein [Chitinispirillaceae bacterium]